jgi:hypothetical protein
MRMSEVEQLLADRGHDLRFSPVRVAAGRSGIAVGFPADPMLHVSWWALLGFALAAHALRRGRH